MEKRLNVADLAMKLDEVTVEKVWNKAKPAAGFTFFRKDSSDSLIAMDEYGKKSDYGWEVTYITPPSQGGTHDVSNLQPVHWKNKVG